MGRESGVGRCCVGRCSGDLSCLTPHSPTLCLCLVQRLIHFLLLSFPSFTIIFALSLSPYTLLLSIFPVLRCTIPSLSLIFLSFPYTLCYFIRSTSQALPYKSSYTSPSIYIYLFTFSLSFTYAPIYQAVREMTTRRHIRVMRFKL